MSLRLRLSLLITTLFLISVLLGALHVVATAKEKVSDEVQSTATLTKRLLKIAFSEPGVSAESYNFPEDLNQKLLLEGIRHLDIEIKPRERKNRRITTDETEASDIDAPDWFVWLVRPDQDELILSISQLDNDSITIRTNPRDEIEEVWVEAKSSLLIGFITMVVLNGILFILIGHWLKPVEQIVRGLEEVERGDYSRRITNLILPELKLIAEKFNHLSAVLGASKAENDRLAKQSLAIQEQERRRMAQELHDEMGQSISAIKAIAVTLSLRNQGKDEVSVSHAGKIEAISSRIYDNVRVMIGQLRPLILDELGLAPALRQMTDEWNDRHAGAFCRLTIEGNPESLGELQRTNVYRIAQESLTNAAKHANARIIHLFLCIDGNKETCGLSITDDGKGFDQNNIKRKMGLRGIEERTKALGGKLSIHTAPGMGVEISVNFPFRE